MHITGIKKVDPDKPVFSRRKIIAGHHLLEASKRAGFTEVPWWIVDLTDDEAFMQLVMLNAER